MRINAKKVALIGLAATTLFTTTSCNSKHDKAADENNNTEITTEKDQDGEIDPSENMSPTVYGPPKTE